MYQLAIPQHRDPVARGALVVCALALVWLAISSALPAASAKEEPQKIIIVATATPVSQPPQAPAPALAAATAAPVLPAPVAGAAPVEDAPTSQIVTNADGSISLPGSEAWMRQQQLGANTVDADPQLQIERGAAAAYQQLQTAAAPSEENRQPSRARRPHTGR